MNEIEAAIITVDFYIKELQLDNARLVALLKEWMDAPYFETFEEWAIWVADFMPRVEEAVKSQEV